MARKDVDVILSMTRLSSEQDVYQMEVQFFNRGKYDKPRSLIAPAYPMGGDKFMIIEERVNRATGKTTRIPRLARLDNPEGFAQEALEDTNEIARREKSRRGTKRFGLGHF